MLKPINGNAKLCYIIDSSFLFSDQVGFTCPPTAGCLLEKKKVWFFSCKFFQRASKNSSEGKDTFVLLHWIFKPDYNVSLGSFLCTHCFRKCSFQIYRLQNCMNTAVYLQLPAVTVQGVTAYDNMFCSLAIHTKGICLLVLVFTFLLSSFFACLITTTALLFMVSRCW